ncbi:MAG: hypothetical protein V7K89_33270 [Nostoc sp.]|uniref:hypothetical protein n=1 Tax=Nostoc sp. TaxID=1180 RepID=UPI002FF8FBE7
MRSSVRLYLALLMKIPCDRPDSSCLVYVKIFRKLILKYKNILYNKDIRKAIALAQESAIAFF